MAAVRGPLPNEGARKAPGKPKTLFDGRLLRELGSSKAGKAALETLAKRRTSLFEAKSRHYAPIEDHHLGNAKPEHTLAAGQHRPA
jgi:hypothetical protein